MTERDDAELVSDGPVERWLDEVFDGLTGTGAGGRRALAEIEDHLRTAVAEGMADGMPADEAERVAVARFGPPARVARGIRATYRNRLRPAVTGIWLLAGAAALASGLVTVLTAVLEMYFEDGQLGGRCTQIVADSARCGDPGGHRYLAFEGLALVGAGLVALVALHLGRRFTPMRGAAWLPRRRTQVVVGTLAAIAGAVALGNPTNALGVPQFDEYSRTIPAVCAVAACVNALVAAAWLGRVRVRPTR